MYSSSQSRSQKLKKFNSIISTFGKLKAAQLSITKYETSKETSFNNLITLLYKFRKGVLRVREKGIKKLVKRKQDKFHISTFNLMEYHFDENTHSNILEYIFDYKLVGPKGAAILSSFVKMTSQEFEPISKLIKKKNYTIRREYSVEKGRIDLFIKDDTNKFVVVIENKILSPVSIKASEFDSETTISKTQLTNYHNAISKRFPSPHYKQAFILLSYSAIEEPEKYHHFKFIDYSSLLKILDSTTSLKANILDEYRLLLHSLGKLNPNELLKLKRDFSSYLYGYKISNQTLNSIEQLRNIIHGNN